MAENIEGSNVGMYMEKNVFSKAPGITEMCKIVSTEKSVYSLPTYYGTIERPTVV